MNLSKLVVMKLLFILIAPFPSLFCMELNQDNLQHELFSAVHSNNANRAAFCVAAGASLYDTKKDRLFKKTLLEALREVGPQGKEMVALFSRFRPELKIIPPPNGWSQQKTTFASLCAGQYIGIKRLLRFGIGASHALLTHMLNLENSADEALASLSANSPAERIIFGDLAHNLVMLFLNNYDKFKQGIAYFPPDLRSYLAKAILRNHPILTFLIKQAAAQACIGGDSQALAHENVSAQNNKQFGFGYFYIYLTDWTRQEYEQERYFTNFQRDASKALLCADLSNDASKAAFARRDGKIVILKADEASIIHEFVGKNFMLDAVKRSVFDHPTFSTIQFSKDDAFLLTACFDSIARIFSVESGTCLYTLEGHEKELNSAYFHPTNPELVLTSSNDGTAKIWNFKKEMCLHTLEDHTASVSWASFNHKGTLVATASYDKSIRIWDTKTGKLLALIPCGLIVKKVLFTPDDTKLYAELKNRGTDYENWEKNLYRLYDLKSVFELPEWFSKCTFEETLLLHAIYCLHEIDSVLAKRSYFHKPKLFDFMRCPHLREVYKKFPENVQLFLAPYVDGIELPSANEEAYSENA